MSKATETVLSKRNVFYVPKQRYYELKHFCMQFWEWQKRRNDLMGLATRENRSPTEREAIEKAELDAKIKMVLDAAVEAGGDIYKVLLDGVTRGLSYDTMSAKQPIPYCRDSYYIKYRYFFWLLDRARN